MRWVVAQPGPSWSVHDVYVGWVEALRAAGEQVHTFQLDDRLALYDNAMLQVGDPLPDGQLRLRKALAPRAAIDLAVNGLAAELWKLRPDVLLVVSGFFIPAEMLDHARRTGTRVVLLHTEQPYELTRELALAEHADLNLLNDPTHAARFAEVAPTFYVPHAYRPSVHHPGPGRARLAADLAFVGTGFGSRRWFFEQLAELGALDGRDVLLAGNWQGLADDSPLRPFIGADDPGHCLDNEQAAEIYRSATLGLNLYRREANEGDDAEGWAMSPREVEMAACGLPFLRDPRPEGDEVLHMLPRFTGPGEAAELLTWWLGHDDARRKAADQAREAVAERTFDHHAQALVRLLTPKG